MLPSPPHRPTPPVPVPPPPPPPPPPLPHPHPTCRAGLPSGGYLERVPRPTPADWAAAFPCEPVDWAALGAPPPDAVQATWAGHSSFLVQLEGLNFLTDPVFSQRCRCRGGAGGQGAGGGAHARLYGDPDLSLPPPPPPCVQPGAVGGPEARRAARL